MYEKWHSDFNCVRNKCCFVVVVEFIGNGIHDWIYHFRIKHTLLILFYTSPHNMCNAETYLFHVFGGNMASVMLDAVHLSARSFTYYIFAVVYFGYDKSLLYLNHSICKVINFSLYLYLIPSIVLSIASSINWNEWNDILVTNQYIIWLFVLWMSSRFFSNLIFWARPGKDDVRTWYHDGHCSATTTEIISFPRNIKIALVVSCT